MVCQGLQSCLEPGFLETRATIDKLANFSPFQKNPITNLESESKSQEHEKEIKVNDQQDLLCWSFLQQSLLHNNNNNNNNNNNTNNGMEMEAEKTEEVYVHPLSKLSSSSTLSTQSLEMCTEGLGSETGSNNSMDDDDEIMAVDLSSDTQQSITDSNSGPERGRRIQHSRMKTKKKKKGEYLGNYPPPLLTLISGTDGIQLKPHREDGRLVLKAVPFSHKSCFLADRTGGRLRLFSLSNDDNNNRNTNTEDYVSCEEEEDCIKDGGSGGGCGAGKKIESESNDQNSTEEFARRSSRCSKEEDPRNIISGLNWESVWVAIS